MPQRKGLLEKFAESNTGKNIMFKDRRTGKVMSIASTLNLINSDPQLQELYEIRKVDGKIFIQSKRDVENLE